MNMKTWNNTDKSEWASGEWVDEPDKAQWVSSNLDCLIVRGPMGALCGYVGVPESHPMFEKDYNSADVEVHGGLTFANRCSPSPEGDHKGICHVEEGAANETVWWLGFDCGHAWDVIPRYDFTFGSDETYRNFSYVKKEVEGLARQLA
jgi:hypothetical protein